jgi:iron complex outermembrane receptor protein
MLNNQETSNGTDEIQALDEHGGDIALWQRRTACGTCLAQQADAPAPGLADSATPPAQVSRTRADKIEEVIVTAQRRSENIQTVPVAVTAISADTLQQRVFNDPSQVQLLAPSLQSNGVSAAPGIANYSIRGVGTASFSNAIEYSVSTVIDDVVLARGERACACPK